MKPNHVRRLVLNSSLKHARRCVCGRVFHVAKVSKTVLCIRCQYLRKEG